MTAVGPLPGAVVDRNEVEISAQLEGLAGDDAVHLLVDGEPVPSEQVSLFPRGVRARVELRDGRHWVRVKAVSSGPFSREVGRTWEFRVDTVEPVAEVPAPRSPRSFAYRAAPLRIRFRESVTPRLKIDGEVFPLEQRDGVWEAIPRLEEGLHRLSVVATDAAGNIGRESWEMWADYTPPRGGWAEDTAGTWFSAGKEVFFSATDNFPGMLEARVWVDEELLEVRERAGDGEGRFFSVHPRDLAEGLHTLRMEILDRGGHTLVDECSFLVDTEATFGERPMVPGAEGGDVVGLQRALAWRGYGPEEYSRVFDTATEQAVLDFKRDQGLEAGPVVDEATLGILRGSIRIDISERQLHLLDGEEVRKTYPVAVGQPRYPTPRGEYEVVNKAKNPTWSPPPSPWAEGMEPVPPGPENPLGTRWIGLSARHVGIHGTYSGWSVGTAASHGCIRMHIGDVEELFELVFVGTPVEIVR